MGGRGRPRKKDPPPKGGAATKTIDLKDDNGEQNSISMGLEIEESGRLSPDLGEKERDAKGILLDLAVSTQGQRKSSFDASPRDGRVDKGKSEAGPVEGKVAKGKKGDVGSTSDMAMSPSARWSDLIKKEKGEFQPSLKQKPLRSWASVVEGNRDISKGWDLQYIKPQDPTGAMVITEDEWVKGSKIWENALVPKAFMLRNGVFLFDFGNGDAKQAVLERRWTFNGHPLILNQWTPNFDPDNLDISKIPVWIQFPELYLSLWNLESLGKLASYVGVPIATDALTAKRQRVAYARMLVKMEIMDTLPHVVPIIGPKGVFQQPVVFEWEPVRCGKCRNLGHEERNCTTKEKKVWVPKKPAKEQVVNQIVGTKSSEGNDELCGGEVQTATNSANVKQSTLSRPSGKLIVESNEQSPVQLEVGAMKSVNLQSETSTGIGDKEMMQKAAGGESSVNLRVTEVIQTDQLLHVEVCFIVGDVKFLCTIVYAFNTFDGRVALWDQVRALDVENVPWIISGDFNTTLNYGERVKPSGVVWGGTSELKDFVSRMEVFDLQFSGAFFTWSNKQGESDRLWCKLDKVMANSTWVSAFPNTSVVFLNPQSLDHSPSLVTVDVLMNEKPRPFRFCNAWSKDENFLDLNALFDETLAVKEKELQRELTKLERANLSVIAQQAKVTWLKEMDSNSAYFHAKVKERQHRSVINSILNSEGVRVTQPKLIEQEFLMFYQKLFGKAKEGVQAADMNVIRRGRVLTTKESEELCRPFTAKEVETALFSIPYNKSPGPDGFTSGFSVLINRQPKGYFQGQRGLQQGDPISPYLFVLVMEYLTRKLKELDMQEKFKYHSKCRVMQLTHLIFADDIMLFCKADEESTILMMQKFEEFARVSGLEVNRMKSQVFFSGVKKRQKVALIQKLGFAEEQLPVRYLGLPLISKKLSPGACKVQLVNYVLFHIQVFWSGALLIPKKVLKLIDAACRNFIWCGKWNYNAMSLIALDDVCVPRKEGGLGVKKLLHWNKATLGKLVWNICQHQESLWVKWAQVVLLRGENFWKVKIPANCAWTWRQVLKLRPLLKNIICMQVGDGRQVSLFYDWWACELRFCELISKDEIAVWGHDFTVSEWWDGLD
ncbi:hypothetical protein SLEP1_g52351 [Rubroshorea leprosula]|uniref:Reverse transcriptase domain-containing protein n=1 Tax=Rubroshorea leprosula TaxID=152421 RepID=A0AAV5M712_9ROSI|nr:hypothetical protein SLEP1_g52351 [Rubroshorea leprosula]